MQNRKTWRPFVSAAPALAALLLAACLDDTVEFDSRSVSTRSLAARIDSIKPGLAALRGLAFSRPIRVGVISREEYTAQIKGDLATMPLAVDRFYSLELAQLGFFLDSSTSIKQKYGDFYGSFPAGYYVDGTDSIYVLSEYAKDPWFLSHGLPHELTHALQDQALHAFGGHGPFAGPAYYADDFDQFRRCLYEGDAELASTAYEQNFDLAKDVAQSRRQKDWDRWAKLAPPESFFAPAASPYGSGMAMVGEAFAAGEGRYANVDAMYKWTTASSRTVMTMRAEAGIPIDFSGVAALVDTTLGLVDDFGMGCMHTMAVHLPRLTQEAFDSGMGWTGDRFLYTRKDGQRLGTLVWAQLFETPQQASFAFSSLSQLLPGRFQGTTYAMDLMRNVYPGTYDETATFTSDGLYSVLIRKGNETWWVENAGGQTDAIITALGRRPGPVVALAKGSAVTRELPPCFNPPKRKRFVFPR